MDQLTVEQLEFKLKELAKTSREPTPSVIDLYTIYVETKDLHNVEVRKTVADIWKNKFRHGTDVSQWHRLSTSTKSNPSALNPANRAEFHKHFIKEMRAGRYIVNKDIKVHARIPFFLKPEGNGKNRFIPDYTYPKNGISVNSLVPQKLGHVELNTKLELITFSYNGGKTKSLGKNDKKSWYRQIPMARQDWSISVHHWCGIDFIDTRMPWGTRVASRVAHHFSIAITHIAYKYIPRSMKPCYFNYIDDTIVRGNSHIETVYAHLIYIWVCTRLLIQLNLKKTVLITTILIGLGILLDVNVFEAGVTEKRCEHMDQQLTHLASLERAGAKYCQSVAGKCEDIAFILYPLRVYLRYLRDSIPVYTDPDQTVIITSEIKQMCQHWKRALKYLHRRKMENILQLPLRNKHIAYSDASNVGYGFIHATRWFYGAFFSDEVRSGDENNIRERELYPILIAAMTLGPYWTGQVIHLKIDNKNAVAALVNKDIRNKDAHALCYKNIDRLSGMT